MHHSGPHSKRLMLSRFRPRTHASKKKKKKKIITGHISSLDAADRLNPNGGTNRDQSSIITINNHHQPPIINHQQTLGGILGSYNFMLWVLGLFSLRHFSILNNNQSSTAFERGKHIVTDRAESCTNWIVSTMRFSTIHDTALGGFFSLFFFPLRQLDRQKSSVNYNHQPYTHISHRSDIWVTKEKRWVRHHRHHRPHHKFINILDTKHKLIFAFSIGYLLEVELRLFRKYLNQLACIYGSASGAIKFASCEPNAMPLC